jgi:hypothetical protein
MVSEGFSAAGGLDDHADAAAAQQRRRLAQILAGEVHRRGRELGALARQEADSWPGPEALAAG